MSSSFTGESIKTRDQGGGFDGGVPAIDVVSGVGFGDAGSACATFFRDILEAPGRFPSR